MTMDVYTDFPERLRTGLVVFVGDEHQAQLIRSRRQAGNALLVSFDGFDDPESAAVLRNQFVYVRADDRPTLDEGEYYHHELLGLQVVSEDGQLLGELVEILSLPANDVYIVRPAAGAEILLPAIKSVILDVDLPGRQMRVHLLPGLIPE
jgi:16S rRNA processing protein RimM